MVQSCLFTQGAHRCLLPDNTASTFQDSVTSLLFNTLSLLKTDTALTEGAKREKREKREEREEKTREREREREPTEIQ